MEQNLHKAHRARMRRRVEQGGIETLAEHEMLEYLLYQSIPQADTNPLAHRLLARFGGFAQVLEADERELCTVEGIGPATARLLHTTLLTAQFYNRQKARRVRRLDTPKAVREFFVPLFTGLRRERIYMALLDGKCRILRTVLLAEGDASTVQIPLSKVAYEAAHSGAACCVLAHNHPGGAALPSNDDVAATAHVMETLCVLHVAVLDHLIVADGESCSMQETRRMPEYNKSTGQVRLEHLHYLYQNE